MSNSITLDFDQINQLFPYSIISDKEGLIVQLGSSLKNLLLEACESESILNVFT